MSIDIDFLSYTQMAALQKLGFRTKKNVAMWIKKGTGKSTKYVVPRAIFVVKSMTGFNVPESV